MDGLGDIFPREPFNVITRRLNTRKVNKVGPLGLNIYALGVIIEIGGAWGRDRDLVLDEAYCIKASSSLGRTIVTTADEGGDISLLTSCIDDVVLIGITLWGNLVEIRD